MTCIAGIANGDNVWIGGDSAGVGGWDLTVRADAKVFRNGPYIMGFTTSFRMGQILRYSIALPVPDVGADLMEFMCTHFVNAVRDGLKAGGYAKKESEQESGGTFLVGIFGRLFAIWDNYQVAESASAFDAVGCGAQIANGALYALRDSPLQPEARIRRALEASEALCAGVRGPFTILSDSPDALG